MSDLVRQHSEEQRTGHGRGLNNTEEENDLLHTQFQRLIGKDRREHDDGIHRVDIQEVRQEKPGNRFILRKFAKRRLNPPETDRKKIELERC